MRFRAVYTVEAAWVMAICIGIVMASIMLAFHIYHETIHDIESHVKTEVDAPKRFRQIQAGQEMIEELLNKEK
ncbi:MAG: hypothetical protein K6A05_06895 [Lachnospiraceae bacterium]|nr:hypothetical protein [Lachnospiraceae bacterium]